jgi:hypothetical protein
MTITITHLSWREKMTPPVGPWPAVPFLIVNICWKVTPDGDDDTHTHKMFLNATEDYNQVQTLDDPAKFDEFIESNLGLGNFRYPGMERRYTLNDKKWHYLEKFDTFWSREWVADCLVTRAILRELEAYQKLGKFPSVYRGVDAHIMYQHIDTLQRYWD